MHNHPSGDATPSEADIKITRDLIRAGQLPPSGKLPPVVPIVLYNGRGRWTAPHTVESLVEPLPSSLAPYCPRLRYVLLDEGRYTERELAPLRNLVAAAVSAGEQS